MGLAVAPAETNLQGRKNNDRALTIGFAHGRGTAAGRRSKSRDYEVLMVGLVVGSMVGVPETGALMLLGAGPPGLGVIRRSNRG